MMCVSLEHKTIVFSSEIINGVSYIWHDFVCFDLLLDAEDEILNQISRLYSIDVFLDREHAQLILFAVEPCRTFLAICINKAITWCYNAK